ncbi:unnamed protein product [Caenorhabditis sp. 36 PRJEB53466]|nr:unnamed protein product [Caenorhabditis sp. 36 PRJEB53466]
MSEGAKRQYVKDLEAQAGKQLKHLVDVLKVAPYESKATSTARAYRAENVKRNVWTEKMQLPKNESTFLLYLMERGTKIGSSALSKISAAYQAANDGISKIFVREIPVGSVKTT